MRSMAGFFSLRPAGRAAPVMMVALAQGELPGLLHRDVDVVLARQVALEAQEAVALVAQVEQTLDLDRLAHEGLVLLGAVGAAVAAPTTTATVARLAVALACAAAPWFWPPWFWSGWSGSPGSTPGCGLADRALPTLLAPVGGRGRRAPCRPRRCGPVAVAADPVRVAVLAAVVVASAPRRLRRGPGRCGLGPGGGSASARSALLGVGFGDGRLVGGRRRRRRASAGGLGGLGDRLRRARRRRAPAPRRRRRWRPSPGARGRRRSAPTRR